MKNLKKHLALALCAAMVLGVLVGCNTNQNSDTGNAASGQNHTVAEIHGTVLLNANACVNISYDADGKVLNVQEVDNDGRTLIADYTGYLQSACADVVAELVELAVDTELLSTERNDVVIKQAVGAKLPSEDFLTKLADAAAEAVELKLDVTVITEADQDQDGNINADKAYELLEKYVGYEKFDSLISSETIIDGVYSFSITVGTLEGEYLVEAQNGYAYEGTVEDPDAESNEIDEETEPHIEEEPTATQETEGTTPATTAPKETAEPVAD